MAPMRARASARSRFEARGTLRLGIGRIRPRIPRAKWAFVLAITAFVCSACLSGRLSRSDVSSRIGHASERDIIDVVPETLRRHGYLIYNNRRTADMLYFETNWKTRAPFEDEVAQGAEVARTRIIVRARKSSDLYFTVRLEAQNQVRGIPVPTDREVAGWSTIPATDLYREYVGALSSDIRLQVDAGQRRRGSGG